MKLTLRVTKEDIRLGRQGDANCCAIARAVKRLVRPDCRDGVIVCGSVEVEESMCKTLKGNIYDFTAKFDADKSSVKPTEFIIDMPLELIDEKVLAQVRF